MRTVVFDLEIQKQIVPSADKCGAAQLALVAANLAVHGWHHAHTAGISSAVAYVVEAGRYMVYGDTRDEHAALALLLAGADRVVGFNHWRFDYPLLAHATGLPLAEITDLDAEPGARDIDLAQGIWGALGGPVYRHTGLNAVACATLGAAAAGGKAGDGAKAPEWYQQGRWGELLHYNLHDVELTARLHHFIAHHGYCITGDKRILAPRYPAQWL